MTEVRNAYASWSRVYDTNVNHTRDSEALVLKTMVPRTFPDDTRPRVLELGCGTGKNTTWLSAISESVVSVDFSEEMMAMAKQKVAASGRTNVTFHIADLTVPDDWSSFNGHTYDLVVFSLVLEHIRELEPVIRRAAECLAPGGLLYIGEIHPARQYSGSQARFAVDGDKVEKVLAFVHHVSDYVRAAKAASLAIWDLEEWWRSDESRETGVPNVIAVMFKKLLYKRQRVD